MNVEAVPLAALTPFPGNPRRHNERNLRAIRASLQRFGQLRPLVVNRDGVILAGNGTYQAARQLKWPTIRVVRIDLSDADQRAFVLADNRTAELAEWDEQALNDMLRALSEEGYDTSILEFESALTAEYASAPHAEPETLAEPRESAHVEALADAMMYPVPIILTRAQLNRWGERKRELGLRDDTKAFVAIADLE